MLRCEPCGTRRWRWGFVSPRRKPPRRCDHWPIAQSLQPGRTGRAGPAWAGPGRPRAPFQRRKPPLRCGWPGKLRAQPSGAGVPTRCILGDPDPRPSPGTMPGCRPASGPGGPPPPQRPRGFRTSRTGPRPPSQWAAPGAPSGPRRRRRTGPGADPRAGWRCATSPGPVRLARGLPARPRREGPPSVKSHAASGFLTGASRTALAVSAKDRLPRTVRQGPTLGSRRSCPEGNLGASAAPPAPSAGREPRGARRGALPGLHMQARQRDVRRLVRAPIAGAPSLAHPLYGFHRRSRTNRLGTDRSARELDPDARRRSPRVGRPTGLEPATPGTTNQCSDRLSYSRRGPAGPRRALLGQWQAARARSSTPGGPRSAAAPAALGRRGRGGPNAADSAVPGTTGPGSQRRRTGAIWPVCRVPGAPGGTTDHAPAVARGKSDPPRASQRARLPPDPKPPAPSRPDGGDRREPRGGAGRHLSRPLLEDHFPRVGGDRRRVAPTGPDRREGRAPVAGRTARLRPDGLPASSARQGRRGSCDGVSPGLGCPAGPRAPGPVARAARRCRCVAMPASGPRPGLRSCLADAGLGAAARVRRLVPPAAVRRGPAGRRPAVALPDAVRAERLRDRAARGSQTRCRRRS